MIKVNAFDFSTHAVDLASDDKQLIERRAKVLGSAYQLFYDYPLHLVRGNGAQVFDKDGKRYLDCYNNVVSVGHCHPKVVEALTLQAQELNTHTRYLHSKIIDYAEQLLSTMPNALGHIMFTCTGSEANDLALRIARDYTGGTGIIVTDYAYHGVTAAIAEVSPSMGEYVAVGKDVRLIPPPLHDTSQPEKVAQQFLNSVLAAIHDMQVHGIKPAALLFDTLFTSDGVFADPKGFIQAAVQAIRDAGGIFIADEVQAGFARSGSDMWGFQRHGVIPDIVTMGKPMGNGHPIGGVAVKPQVSERFGKNASYFNTFGGNPVSAAVGLAVLAVIEDEGLMANAASIGRQLKSGLEQLADTYHVLGQVRGAGLFIGVDIVDDSGRPDGLYARKIANDMRHHGVLIGLSGQYSNILKIRPPLCLSQQNADFFLQMLAKVVA